MAFNLNGLSSGMDTKAIVQQLMQLEGRGRTRVQWQKSLWEARGKMWDTIDSKLGELRSHLGRLMSATTWVNNGSVATNGTATSSNAAVVSANADPTAVDGTYNVEVFQLAQGEISQSTGSLPTTSTSAVRTTGAWYEAAGDTMEATDRLRTLTTAAGAPGGLAVGSTLTMNWTVGGVNYSGSFGVTNTNTLQDLANWMAGQVGNGATATVSGGQIAITTAAGTSNSITNMTLSANATFNATASSQTTETTAATDPGAQASDTLTITQGASTWNVAIAQGDSMAVIASKINAGAGAGVAATWDGTSLTLTSANTGANQAFTVSSAGSLAATLGFTELQTAQDASYSVDGVLRSSGTNTGASGAIAGVTLDLNALTAGTPVTLNVTAGSPSTTVTATADDPRVKAVKDFVTAYNETLELLNKTYTDKKVPRADTLTEYLKAPLGGAGALTTIMSGMRRMTMDAVGGADVDYNTLAEIGISTGNPSGAVNRDSVQGKLVLDETKLIAALNDDPNAVRAAFDKAGAALGDQGVSRRLGGLIDQWRSSGGPIQSGEDMADAQIRNMNRSLEMWDRRLQLRQARYERQFSAMETMMSQLQSNGFGMMSQFS